MNKQLNLFLTFLKIGAITFGGGYAMISMIKQEIVDKKKWLTDEELMELTVVAESSPGPIAINAATFVGYKIDKFRGAILSTLAVAIPSITIITIISFFFQAFISNKYVAYAFVGIKAAVAYLILEAGYRLFKHMDKKPFEIILFLISFIALFIFESFNKSISSIYFIIIAGLAGIIYTAIKRNINKNQEKEEIK